MGAFSGIGAPGGRFEDEYALSGTGAPRGAPYDGFVSSGTLIPIGADPPLLILGEELVPKVGIGIPIASLVG